MHVCTFVLVSQVLPSEQCLRRYLGLPGHYELVTPSATRLDADSFDAQFFEHIGSIGREVGRTAAGESSQSTAGAQESSRHYLGVRGQYELASVPENEWGIHAMGAVEGWEAFARLGANESALTFAQVNIP